MPNYSRSRTKRVSAIDARYKVLEPKSWVCRYCGMPAETTDHCPPIPAAYAVGADVMIERGYPLLKVRACSECNTALSDRPLYSIAERVQYLIEVYAKRYKKLIRSPKWTVDELNELGDGYLGSYVIAHENAAAIACRRLEHLAIALTQGA